MKLLRLWRLARYLQHQTDQGCEVIAVPRWLAPELHKLIWERKAARAVKKWDAATAEVSLAQWQAAMQAQGEQQARSATPPHADWQVALRAREERLR